MSGKQGARIVTDQNVILDLGGPKNMLIYMECSEWGLPGDTRL